MTIHAIIEKGEKVYDRTVTGWGEAVLDFPDQKIIIRDLGKPRIFFEPPLSRKPILHGSCEKLTTDGVEGIDGQFFISDIGFRIFGEATETVLKEPDNSLMP